jgi:hypothetical protein
MKKLICVFLTAVFILTLTGLNTVSASIPSWFWNAFVDHGNQSNARFDAVEAENDVQQAQIDALAEISNLIGSVCPDKQFVAGTNSSGNFICETPASSTGGGAQSLPEFVGFSTTKVNGGAGWKGMTAACTSEFGPDAKMATEKEIVQSKNFVESAEPFAWIVAEAFRNRSDVMHNIRDCRGFSRADSGEQGQIVNPSNYSFPNPGIGIAACNNIYAVACSLE